jgi:NosR/NirI family nitrous oxide reductase transcriptional regulator
LKATPLRRFVNLPVLLGFVLAILGEIAALNEAHAASRLSEYLTKAEPGQLIPGANRLGPLQGDPAIAPAYRGDDLLGFVYLNSDFANATGYSGKPIQLLVGISP